jgi:hypothetical protein
MTREEALAGARRTLSELRALEEKKSKLLAEMERSLAILQLWPDAFAHGAINSAWTGLPTKRDFRGTVYDLRLRVTDGAGTVKEFPQAEVPPILWPTPVAGRLP